MNLLWAFASVPWLVVAAACVWLAADAAQAWQRPGVGLVGAGVGFTLVALSPPTCFAFCATAPWARGRNGDLAEAWRRARRLAAPVQAAGVAVAASVAILLANALYYQALGGWVGLALSGFMLWLLVGALLAGQYLLPLLVARPEATLRQAVGDAVLLVLGNLRLSLGLLLGAATCIVLGAASGVGLALGAVSAVALLLNLGLARVLERYGGEPIERDRRGWRDLLRPWS